MAVSSNIEEIGGNVNVVVMRTSSGINEGVSRLCSQGAFCGHIDEVVVHVFAGSGFDDRRVDGGDRIGAVLRQHRFDHHFTARLSATGQSGCGEDFRQLCSVNAVSSQLLLHGINRSSVLRQRLLLPLALQGGGQRCLGIGIAVFQAAPQQG